MNTHTSDIRAVARYFLLLFGLCIPVWVIGPLYDVELFPGFKLFQVGLAMPMIAALILTYYEYGWLGTVALLRRTLDARRIRPKIWFLPILLIFPSIGFINYCVLRLSGVDIPPPTYSLTILLGYCTVFFLACAEEIGLSGYALDRLQSNYSALATGIILGIVWAGYHIPGFLISGYFTTEWIFWHAVFTVVTRVLFVWIYNNAGRSFFAMALCHWTFGLFWILWPQDNLQKAVPFYNPLISAVVAILYVVIVVCIWRPQTLARSRFK